jgi:glycosyltransferase involved in cell wall biosynthesis
MPVYNGTNYLREAIDSALAQEYKNTEVIVVNDGSTDNTEEICLSYGDRIRYFSKENGGVATALNLGVTQMRGEYFSWLSHDDVYYPNKISSQIEALYACDDRTRIAYGNYDMINESGALLQSIRFLDEYTQELLMDSVFPILKSLIGGCALLIHRSHFEKHGLFKTELRYVQDYDMWFRMMRGQRLVYVDAPMYKIRIHDRQGTKTATERMRAEEAVLWLGFTRAVTANEMCRMFGGAYEFYREMYIRHTAFGDGPERREIERLIAAQSVPDSEAERRERILCHLHDAGSTARRLCVFCAGDYGIRLFYDFRLKNIAVDYFADNDPAKHKEDFLDGIPCLSFEELLKIKDDTLVIVAASTPAEILEQLRNAKFPLVTTKQEIDKMARNYRFRN